MYGEKLSAAYLQRVGRYTDPFTARVPKVAFIQGRITISAAVTRARSLTPTDAYPNWNTGLLAQRDVYNALVRGRRAAADAVLDFAANAVLGETSADTSLFGDNLHPKSLSYSYLASAPSGAYSASNTYYAALLFILLATPLGSSYIP